jgi:hypothetical protein
MAGKGDMPRPVDGPVYEANYVRIDWSKHKDSTRFSSKPKDTDEYDLSILDPDTKKRMHLTAH